MMAATIVICIVLAGVLVLGFFHFRKTLRSGCCGSGGDAVPTRTRVQDRNLSHYPYTEVLEIGGMSCRNCAAHVQNALNALDGVYAKVNLRKRNATVHMKTKVPDSRLCQAVVDAGYTVAVLHAGTD